MSADDLSGLKSSNLQASDTHVPTSAKLTPLEGGRALQWSIYGAVYLHHIFSRSPPATDSHIHTKTWNGTLHVTVQHRAAGSLVYCLYWQALSVTLTRHYAEDPRMRL